MIAKEKKEYKLLKLIQENDFVIVDENRFIDIAKATFNRKNKDIAVISPLNIDVDPKIEDEFFLCIYDPSNNYKEEEILTAIDVHFKSSGFSFQKNLINVYVIEIFDSISDRNKVKTTRESLNNISKTIKSYLNSTKVKFKYNSVTIPSEIKKDSEIVIHIDDRIRSLEQEYILFKDENTVKKVVSYVFTANIDDIVEIYDICGNSLFDNNIRIGGIKDKMGVDDAIKETYQNHYDEFWFLNNGVSLLIDSNTDLKMEFFDRISFKMGDINNISIINGAQTIKAISELYKKDRQDKAKVLLRIYFFNRSKDEKGVQLFSDFSEKVTISLNKQKPITQVDLAYLSNFVKNIEYLKTIEDKTQLDGFTFDIVRRGEVESINLCQYQLDSFAKITLSYLAKKPGHARTSSYSTLLKTRLDEETQLIMFKDSEIFKDDFQELSEETNDENYKKIFLRHYKPMNFAMSLKKFLEVKVKKNRKVISNFEEFVKSYYSDKSPKLSEEEIKRLESFAKYGTYFMVSAVVNYLNDKSENNNDFSGWNYKKISLENHSGRDDEDKDGALSIGELKKTMRQILDKFLEITKDKGDIINDSNYWKSDDLINELIPANKEIVG